VVVLRTVGARERPSGRRARRGVAVEDSAEAEPVPVVRATLVGAEPVVEPDAWLDALRGDADAREAEVAEALRELNAIVRAHRAAAADPYAREIGRWQAGAVRIGYGSGDQVADGRWSDAYELPEPRERVRRAEGLMPQERLASVLGGSGHVLAAEELVLRARLDLAGDRPREAALQARIALEALLAELPEGSAELAPHRDPVGRAANAALEGDPPEALQDAVAEAVTAMRRVVAAAVRSSGSGA
jgi:hypothetical protein